MRCWTRKCRGREGLIPDLGWRKSNVVLASDRLLQQEVLVSALEGFYQMCGELLGLQADFRNSCRFPEFSLARGSKSKERTRGLAFVVDQRSVRVDVKAQKQRVRARQSLHEEAGDQRIVDAPGIGFRACAIDHAMRVQVLEGRRSPLPVSNVRSSWSGGG